MFNFIEKFTDPAGQTTPASTVQGTTSESSDGITSTAAPVTGTTGSTTPGSTTPGSTTPGSTTPGSTTPGSTTTTATDKSSNMDVGLIVGATLGSIALIVILIWIARKRVNKRSGTL
jgi:hypothetical protein